MKSSIQLKISILFAIVCLLIGILFVISLKRTQQTYDSEQHDYHENVVKFLVSNYNLNSDKNLTRHLMNSGFKLVEDKKLAQDVKQNGKYHFKMMTDFGLVSSISYDYALFLEMIDDDEDILFKTKRSNIAFEFMLFGFLLSVVLVFVLYLSIMKSLTPLGKLRKQIALAVSGEDFFAQDFKRDDIGEIATDFSDTIERMHELVESRQLFLRTIMHEFKTPIGKGRLVAEMIKEKKQKERLVDIFTRLDTLINESAKIESLFSKNYTLEIRPHRFDEVLEQAKKMLLDVEFDKKVKVKKSDKFSLNVDIDSFALALKNLIENALKYSDDGICTIECFENGFVVKNKGKPFKHDYTEYLKPFIREKDNKKEGLGLGLYIVDKTCVSHRFELSYEYKGSNHCFKVITDSTLVEQKGQNFGDEKSDNTRANFVSLQNHLAGAKLAQDIENAIRFIKPCSKCGALSENELCEICADDERDRDLLCLVEDAKDILILEESGSFNGLYFVLDELNDEKVAKLRAMILEFSVKELVFALTHSVNAEAMSFFVEDKLSDLNLSMSKIAQGVPSGVHLENVDFISLHKAMVFRTKLK